MEIKGTEMDSIEKYLELSRTCPELFAQSEELPLVLDPKELYAFAQKVAEESELYTRAITI